MKIIIFLALVVTMLPNSRLWAQSSSGDDPIRVILPQGLEARSCQLRYSLVGSFGSYGGFTRPKLHASEFEIETVHEGTAADSLKALLYCSGYQLQTLTFDSLPALAGRTVQLHPQPLGTVRFLGVVRGLFLQNAQVLYVDVDYTPWWVCEFFRLVDCGLDAWNIASVKLDTDGTFSATLPDVAQDAVISSFTHPGEFAFRIRDQRTGNTLIELKAVGSGSPTGGVPASGIPSVHVFDAELK